MGIIISKGEYRVALIGEHNTIKVPLMPSPIKILKEVGLTVKLAWAHLSRQDAAVIEAIKAARDSVKAFYAFTLNKNEWQYSKELGSLNVVPVTWSFFGLVNIMDKSKPCIIKEVDMKAIISKHIHPELLNKYPELFEKSKRYVWHEDKIKLLDYGFDFASFCVLQQDYEPIRKQLDAIGEAVNALMHPRPS